MVNDVYSILTIICAFVLLLLAISVFQNVNKRFSNIFLGIFFIAQLFTFLNILLYHNFNYLVYKIPYLYNIATPFWFFWGPSFYLTIFYEYRISNNFSWKQLLHFLPAIVILVYLIFTFYVKSNDTKIEILLNNSLLTVTYNSIKEKLLMLHVALYIALSIIKVKKYENKLYDFKINEARHKWNLFIIYGYLTACIIYDVTVLGKFLFYDFETFKHLSLIIFTTYFIAILYRSLSSSHFSYSIEKERLNSLKPDDLDQIKNKLHDLTLKEKVYLDPDLTLGGLAELLNIKETKLSIILNGYFKKNFSEFINEFRVIEAKNMLKDPNNVKKTILEIIYAAGFNSKSVFNLVFKKNTGLTPTQFRKKYLT